MSSIAEAIRRAQRDANLAERLREAITPEGWDFLCKVARNKGKMPATQTLHPRHLAGSGLCDIVSYADFQKLAIDDSARPEQSVALIALAVRRYARSGTDASVHLPDAAAEGEPRLMLIRELARAVGTHALHPYAKAPNKKQLHEQAEHYPPLQFDSVEALHAALPRDYPPHAVAACSVHCRGSDAQAVCDSVVRWSASAERGGHMYDRSHWITKPKPDSRSRVAGERPNVSEGPRARKNRGRKRVELLQT